MFDRRKLLRLHHLRQSLMARRGWGASWLRPNPFLELRGGGYITYRPQDGGGFVDIFPQSPMDRVMQFL